MAALWALSALTLASRVVKRPGHVGREEVQLGGLEGGRGMRGGDPAVGRIGLGEGLGAELPTEQLMVTSTARASSVWFWRDMRRTLVEDHVGVRRSGRMISGRTSTREHQAGGSAGWRRAAGRGALAKAFDQVPRGARGIRCSRRSWSSIIPLRRSTASASRAKSCCRCCSSKRRRPACRIRRVRCAGISAMLFQASFMMVPSPWPAWGR